MTPGRESSGLLISLVSALSAATAATAAAAAITDKLEIAAAAAAAAAIADTQCVGLPTVVEEAGRRGSPLADPEPITNPDFQGPGPYH